MLDSAGRCPSMRTLDEGAAEAGPGLTCSVPVASNAAAVHSGRGLSNDAAGPVAKPHWPSVPDSVHMLQVAAADKSGLELAAVGTAALDASSTTARDKACNQQVSDCNLLNPAM